MTPRPLKTRPRRPARKGKSRAPTPLGTLHRLFAYDNWANLEVTNTLKACAMPPASATRLLGHIFGTEWVWLGRLQEETTKVAVWPDLSLEQCEAQTASLPWAWEDHLKSLTPGRLAEKIEYINTLGESWSNTVGDILLHVVIHSAYHRGQIASQVRAAGETPADTDFIHAVRQGKVK